MATTKTVDEIDELPDLEGCSSDRKERVQTISISTYDEETEKTERVTWASQSEFILSMVGYAVGLGNIWRFPYICMRNGGGAFLIPYFTFLILCGIPLYLMELSAGQYSSLSPLPLWKRIPGMRGLGYGMLLVSGIVCIYYNVIMAWSFYFMFASFTTGTLPWAACDNVWNTPGCVVRGSLDNQYTNNDTVAMGNGSSVVNGYDHTGNWTHKTPGEEYWDYHVLQVSSGIDDLENIRWPLFGCLVLAWVVVFACLFKGVKSSGKVVYVTATLPYVMLLVLLIRGVTLPGAKEGIMFYLTPDFSRLANFQVWVEACAQIFYSLGPGYGGVITMASYNRFNNNCLRDAILIPCINCFTSFFAGFVVFSILGYMAHLVGTSVDNVITSGPGLAFIVYPEALSTLPCPQLWSVIFFLTLIIIGLDTQFCMMETVTSGFIAELPWLLKGRETLFTSTVCVLELLIGLPLVTHGGVYVFQIFDWYSATFSLITLSTCECLVLGWGYGARRLLDHVSLMTGRRPSYWWRLCWQGLTPCILLTVLISTFVGFGAPTYGSYAYPWWAVALGWVLGMCSLVPVPLWAAVALVRGEGGIVERLQKAFSPTASLRPADSEDSTDDAKEGCSHWSSSKTAESC